MATKRKVPEFMDSGRAMQYGFSWPAGEKAARVQVTRTASIDRGARGEFRVLNVLTARNQINVYISPTGRIRIFDGEGKEYKRG